MQLRVECVELLILSLLQIARNVHMTSKLMCAQRQSPFEFGLYMQYVQKGNQV